MKNLLMLLALLGQFMQNDHCATIEVSSEPIEVLGT